MTGRAPTDVSAGRRARNAVGAGPGSFLSETRAAYERAASTGEHRHSFELGGEVVWLRVAGGSLGRRIAPALVHAPCARGPRASLTIHAWSTSETGVEPPASRWTGRDIPPRGEIAMDDRRGRASWSVGSRALSAFDIATREAFFWVRDPAELPAWESAAPLRDILAWWAHEIGSQLVHGAAVAVGGRAVLLTGPGGSGKSGTSLLCRSRGLDWLGDDYVLLRPGGRPTVHRLYRTAKIDEAFLRARLPELERHRVAGWNADGDKELLLLDEGSGPGTAELTAIARPFLSSGRSRATPLAAGQVLRALAPTTLFQLSGAGARDFGRMAAIARSVPGWRIGLGDDEDELVEAVRRIAHGAGVRAAVEPEQRVERPADRSSAR